MATKVLFTIVETKDCKNIYFTETTGIYDSINNPRGWGAPNELTSDATAATLQLTSPSGVTYPAIDLLATASFPKTSGVASAIPASALDSSLTEYEDGLWTMTYSVTTATTTYSTTNIIFLSCNTEQEVCSLLADISLCDCDCDPDKVNTALKAKAYLYAIECALEYDQVTKATDIFNTLKRLIDCSTC